MWGTGALVFNRARLAKPFPDTSKTSELQAILVWTDTVAHRHVDAGDGAGLAGIRTLE